MKKVFKSLRVFFYALFALALVTLVGCGGSDSTPAMPAYTSQDWQNLSDHNASFNNGHTIRWPGAVATYDIFPESFQRWADATEGRIQFRFVPDQPSDGISVWLGTDLADDIAGLTEIRYNTATGEIVQATIYIHPRRWNPTDAPYVLTHEAGHALGFLGHTNDGCIMDRQFGSGDCISDAVARILTHLYSYRPNTNVNAYLLNAAVVQDSAFQRDGSTLRIKSPHGDYFVKAVDDNTVILSNGPFYTGPVEQLPGLKP